MKKDWEIKKLGDVCEIIGGTTPSTTNKSYWNGTEKWITPAEIDINKKYIYDSVRHITKEAVKACSLQLQPKGTVIFTSRAPIGKVAISEMEFYCNQGFKNFICSERILNEYLYYFLIGNVDYLNSIGKGTTFKEISKTTVSQVEIPLPPLEEQKRIVKILDEKFSQLESLKANAQTNLQNAKDLFQSQLTKAFSNTTWEKEKLRDLTDSSLSYGSSSPSCEYDDEVRYIRITDINDEGFLNEEFVSPKFYDEKHILEDGDVLFARTGATVGKAYCYHNEDGKCVYAGYLIRLRPNQKKVIPDYIYLCTKSKEYEDFIRTSQAAAAQPNVNAEKYGNFEIPLPSLPEQKRIVEELDTLSEKVRQLQEIYTKQIANCDELKQSLLQKAFEGEL